MKNEISDWLDLAKVCAWNRERDEHKPERWERIGLGSWKWKRKNKRNGSPKGNGGEREGWEICVVWIWNQKFGISVREMRIYSEYTEN